MDAILLLAQDNQAQVLDVFAGDLALENNANLVDWRSVDGALRASKKSIGPWTIRCE